MRPDTAPPGLERWLWRHLPAAWLLGSGVPWLATLVRHWASSAGFWPGTEGELGLWTYTSAGWTALMTVLAVTVGVGCVVVRVMKGPAYTADSYPPAPRTNPLAKAADLPPHRGPERLP
jgi:hypothetical protein